MAHGLGRVLERVREPQRALAIVLQEMQRDSLRRLRSDARQAAQCAREVVEPGGGGDDGARFHRRRGPRA